MAASWKAHDERVGPYVRWHRFLSSVQLFLGATVLWGLLRSHSLLTLEQLLSAGGFQGFALFICFFGVLGAGWEVLTFPLSFAHYFIDRRFGVAKQSPGLWLADHVKGLLVGASLGLIVLLFTWYSATQLGALWWVALGAFFVLFSVVLAQLAPVLLLPLFFKLSPLPDGPLRSKLLEMTAGIGVAVREVYLLGLGAKTEKGNALFMGIGRTKRIAIGDTIYQKYPENQVLAVFAHELGHLVHKDIWKGLCLSAVSLFATFGIADFLATGYFLPRWFTFVGAPFGLFLYFVLVGLVGIPFGFLERLYSRWRENLADGFAAKEMKMAQPLADALEALTFQNRSLFTPSPLREFFTYSHPAPWRRIHKLRG
jgi:STE24 endopeptidase